MAAIPSRCPSCEGVLSVVRLSCETCKMQIEGTFELPTLLRLSADDLAFVVRFVQASGSLKEMAHHHNQSYPTIRNRLNAIIRQLNQADDAHRNDSERHAILDALAKGTLSVAVAERRLRALS